MKRLIFPCALVVASFAWLAGAEPGGPKPTKPAVAPKSSVSLPAAPAPASAATKQFSCDSSVHAAKGEHGYASQTPTRCEGLYVRSASDTHIQLLSLTRGKEAALPKEGDVVVAKWSANVARAGNQPVRILGAASYQGKLYQMDGIAALSDQRFDWPDKSLLAAGIPVSAANLRVITTGDAGDPLHIPVLTSPPSPADIYRFTMHTEASIKKLRFTLDEDGQKSETVTVKAPKLVSASSTFTAELSASEVSNADVHRLTFRCSTSAGEHPLVLITRFIHYH
jgi:hypothetical protein